MDGKILVEKCNLKESSKGIGWIAIVTDFLSHK